MLLFQFGPVQVFIAQAETAQDLWAGSDLLSELTESVLKALPEGTEVVFPAKTEGPGLPNRVLAFLPRETAATTARAMADTLQRSLTKCSPHNFMRLPCSGDLFVPALARTYHPPSKPREVRARQSNIRIV